MVVLVVAVFALGVAHPAQAQIGRDSIPSTVYYATFPAFYNGNFQDALGSYTSELRGGIKTAQARWIDSIAYHTMCGECFYQMGQLPLALEQYTSALNLYLAYYNWMISVQFPPGVSIGAAGSRVAVPWGQSKRGSAIGSFPDSYPMQQGQINNNSVVQRGGVVTPPIVVSVNVSEIVRTTCLAMRRRRELLGPMCKHDALSNSLVAKLSTNPGLPNHWSQAWVDVQLGAAYASVGNMPQAVQALQRAIIVGGQYDHPLTSTALLELGRLALEAGNFDAATNMFEEATYSAVNFPDNGILEDAFRLAQMTHLVANRKGLYAPVPAAVSWTKASGPRYLHASLSLLAAENLVGLAQTPAAVNMLADARSTIGVRSDMANSAIGARLNLLTATTSYQMGKVADGDQAVVAAMNYQKNGSLWNFQINLADKAYTGGDPNFSDRIGMMMYETLLRDPTPADWSTSPLESLSVMVIPHPLPLEHWFEAAQGRRGEQDLALEIADRARRHRFYSTLPFGGRLLALRWLLEGPTELLGERGMLQRQDILARYPKYDELAQQARKLRAALTQKPLVEETNEGRREQAAQLANLGAIGQAQELILREIAVRREPAELVFPPILKTKDLQAALQPGQVLLTFFATTRNTYGFVFTREKYTAWRIVAPAMLQNKLIGMLRELGHYDQNHELALTDLQNGAWRKSASRIMELLFDKSQVDLSTKFDELIVVPDASLWYLPFELLPISKDNPRPLLAHCRMRYAPTASLAVPYTRSQKPPTNVGVVVGKLYPQDDETVARGAYERLARSVPGAVALPPAPPAATSIYRSLLDELILLDDIEPSDAGPYDWSPAQLDRGKPGSSLASWFSLPWGGPERVLLPGFHSAAENGLKKANRDGSELFLSICGLMATGTRTILISRWRTGGQTSFDLVREFAQELPHTTPADAWQRAVQLAATSPLDPDAEPRLRKLKAEDTPPKASHPFFWSGYMVVDSGVPAAAAPAAAAIPAALK